MNLKNRASVVVAAISGVAISGAAMATPGYTLIKNNGVYEQQTLTQVYGGTWAKSANGVDFSNGSMTAIRLADTGVNTPTSLTTGAIGSDQTWTGSATVTLTLRGGELDPFSFGYFDDTGTDHSFHQISGDGLLSGPVTVTLPGLFHWGLREGTSGAYMSSRESDNLKSNVTHDQLITYKISGNGVDQFVMFWEDHYHKAGGTQYDDMVVSFGPTSVPGPASASLIGLGGLALAGRRRR